MTNTKNHPVWSLYDEVRTARLNVKYLQRQIRSLRKLNKTSEIVIAIASTSSIGGFWFLQNFAGTLIWKSIGALAILFTTLKPILKFSESIRKKQEILASYKILDHDLQCICIDVRQRQQYDATLQNEFKRALKRKAELVKTHDDADTDEKLRDRCLADVAKELPVESFYIPPK